MSIGLIGAGRWGENLVRNFLQLGVLARVCDRNPATLEKISLRFPTISLTSSYNSILEDDSIRGIVISTPGITHHELAIRALKAGKHVYVEKPLARTPDQARELIDLADSLDLTLMVGHLLLYHPAVNKLKELIEQNIIGDIHFVNSDRRNFALSRADTNVIWDLAPHDLSMISYLLGKEQVELIQANGFSTLQDGIIDVAHIDIKLDGKTYAHIHNSWIDPQKQCLLTVTGSKKTAVINDARQERKLELYSISPDGQVAVEEPIYSTEEPLRLECKHFLDSIAKGNKPLSDGIGGYQVVKLLSQADSLIRSKVPTI